MKTGTLKIKQLVAFALLLGGAFAALQGCQGKTPAAVVFGIPPKAPLASNIIDDLEDGNQLMSINLLGAASVPSTQYVVTPANPNNPSSSSTIQPVYMPSVPLGVWVASSWGGNAVVLQPPELARAVKQAAEKILRAGAPGPEPN